MKRILVKNGLYPAYMLVSNEDYPVLIKTNWNMTINGYAQGTLNGKSSLAHRHILNYPNSRIDHKDRNKLNNQRDNLRLATQSQNLANQNIHFGNKTGVKGVTIFRNKFRVYCGGKYIGLFSDINDAKKAYNSAATTKWGHFAKLN